MEVVDGQHQRRLCGQVQREPMNAVQDGEAAAGPLGPGLAIGLWSDHPCGRGSGGGQQQSAFRLRGRGQSRFEQSADRPERELPFQLVATRIEDAHPGDRRVLAGDRHERALAGSRGPLQHRQTASAPHSVPDRMVEGAKLCIAFQERHIELKKTLRVAP